MYSKLLYSVFVILFIIASASFVKYPIIYILSLSGTSIIFFNFLFGQKRFGISNIFLFGFFYFMFLYPFFYSIGLVEIPGYEYYIYQETTIASVIGLLVYIYANNYSMLFNKQKKFNLSDEKAINSFNEKYFFLLLILSVYLGLSLMPPMVFNKEVILFTAALFFIYVQPKKRNLLAFIVFLGFLSFIILESSGRRDLLKIIIIYLFFIQIYYGNLRLLTLSIFLSIALFGMVIITTLRTFNTGWLYERDIGIADIYQNPEYLKRVLEGYGDYLQNALVLGDFGVAYNNFMYIYKNITEIGFLYGQSLFRLFYTWIPRSIWENKPYDVQLQIVKLNLNPYYTGGSSQSVTFIGEVFWNYGFLAIVLTFFFLGKIIKKIDENLYRLENYQVIALLSLSPFFMLMWRGSFTTTLVYAIANLIIIYFCYFISRVKFVR